MRWSGGIYETKASDFTYTVLDAGAHCAEHIHPPLFPRTNEKNVIYSTANEMKVFPFSFRSVGTFHRIFFFFSIFWWSSRKEARENFGNASNNGIWPESKAKHGWKKWISISEKWKRAAGFGYFAFSIARWRRQKQKILIRSESGADTGQTEWKKCLKIIIIISWQRHGIVERVRPTNSPEPSIRDAVEELRERNVIIKLNASWKNPLIWSRIVVGRQAEHEDERIMFCCR